MEQFLNDYEIVAAKPRSVVNGRVVLVDHNGAWVDFGGKSDALVQRDCFDEGELKVGQTTQFMVASSAADPEDGRETILSYRPLKAFKELQSLMETDGTVEATITNLSRRRGTKVVCGALAKVLGIRAFIPGSHLVRRDESIVGKRMAVKVLKVDVLKGDVALSETQAVEENQVQLLETLKSGQVITGAVTGVAQYGVFVDLGSRLSGLLHRSNIDDRRVAGALAQHFSVGQEVELTVIRVDQDKRQVNLGLSSVSRTRFLETLKPGQAYTGTVSRIVRFGAFVELGQGVAGLLHVSDLPGVRHPREVLNVGQSIQVTISTVDVAREKVALRKAD